MKTKKIVLTEQELRKHIQQAILEHIEEISKIDDRIIIYSYDLSNDEDLYDIENKLNKLWNIVTTSYSKYGGVKGINKPIDLIRKHSLVRIAYLDGNIIAVAFYSNRLGGNKLAFCGSTTEFGKLGMSAIIGRDTDSENIEEYNWVECSGGIEILFRRLGGYNLPNKYASEVLNNSNLKLLGDGYHYERSIGEKTSNVFVKTIYGFNSEELIKKVYNDVFGNLINDIKLAYSRLKDNETLTEDNDFKLYRNRLDTALIIIEKIDELHSNSNINEFPQFLINELKKNITIIKESNNKHKRYADYAEDMLNQITEFKIIKKILKNSLTKSNAL